MNPQPAAAPVVVPETGSSPRVLQALRVRTLTSRELQILQLVADDLTDKAIARRLGISPKTVHAHLAHINHKLKTGSRLGAVMAGIRAGKIRP